LRSETRRACLGLVLDTFFVANGLVVQWIEYLPAGRQGSFLLHMYIVYAIKSVKDGRIYVGFTVDLENRIKEHNSGKNTSTKDYRPGRLIYSELQETRIEAREREKYLKSGIGKEFLRSL